MDPGPTRPARHDDIEEVAALAAARRREYEAQQPRFWGRAADAVARHTAYLHGLVDDPDHVFLVARQDGAVSGFVVGRLVPAPPVYEPGGPTCLVDDFAVGRAEDWPSLGAVLLREMSRAASARGAVQLVVVSGRHDEPKRAALRAAGLVVGTEWWLGPVDGACDVEPCSQQGDPARARSGILTLVSTEGMSARRRVGTSILPGVVVGAGVGFVSQQWDVAALAGWDAAGITFLVWTWRKLWRLDQAGSRRDAEREDPTQALADGILLVAALVSLAAVAVVLATGQSSKGAGLLVNLALAVGSVVVSWAVVHTTFTVKYARLYYSGADGGIDFHDPSSKATYQDFAYLAFTVGMTFQVSDTEINSREIRATVLRHALIAYLFGAVILAATINLIAGLSK